MGINGVTCEAGEEDVDTYMRPPEHFTVVYGSLLGVLICIGNQGHSNSVVI